MLRSCQDIFLIFIRIPVFHTIYWRQNTGKGENTMVKRWFAPVAIVLGVLTAVELLLGKVRIADDRMEVSRAWAKDPDIEKAFD